MKILITSQGNNKDSLMSPKFGRCSYFYIYDIDSNVEEIIKNDAANAGGGAGIQSANFVIDNNIDVLITGNLGPNASEVLNESEIKILTAPIKSVSEIIEDYKQKRL